MGILILLGLFYHPVKAEEGETLDLIVEHPELYIRVTNWSFYTAFRTAIIHHVTIENTSDIAYKDVKVRIRYYSTSPSNYGTQVGQEIGILPVTLPPHSKQTYLREGAVLGAGSSLFNADNLEVLGATAILDQ
ncbi:MAG TPA: hypothetical protein VNN20_05145 [Thermodesulfobacteriota bacterium]|nr:hypothetical protein [Thermodesulfobacteriota bacterium]